MSRKWTEDAANMWHVKGDLVVVETGTPNPRYDAHLTREDLAAMLKAVIVDDFPALLELLELTTDDLIGALRVLNPEHRTVLHRLDGGDV